MAQNELLDGSGGVVSSGTPYVSDGRAINTGDNRPTFNSVDALNYGLLGASTYQLARKGDWWDGTLPKTDGFFVQNLRSAARVDGVIIGVPGKAVAYHHDSGTWYDPNDEPWYFDPRIMGPAVVAAAAAAGIVFGAPAAASSGAAAATAGGGAAVTATTTSGVVATSLAAARAATALIAATRRSSGTTGIVDTPPPTLASFGGMTMTTTEWFLLAMVVGVVFFSRSK